MLKYIEVGWTQWEVKYFHCRFLGKLDISSLLVSQTITNATLYYILRVWLNCNTQMYIVNSCNLKIHESTLHEDLGPKISLIPLIVYLSTCTKPGKWLVMYMFAGILICPFSIGFWNCFACDVFFCLFYYFIDIYFEVLSN